MRWFLNFLTAPRRLRRLGEAHERLLERHRAARLDWKRQVAAANVKVAQAATWRRWHEQDIASIPALKAEVERLRKLNGATYQKYVKAQDRYEQLLQGERTEDLMRKYKVAFCQFPGGGSQRMETNAWVVKTVRAMDRDERVEKVVSLTYADTPITMLRNRAVLEARQAGCQYLLAVDSDMSPDVSYAGCKPFWESSWGFMMARRKREETSYLEWPDGKGRPMNDAELLGRGLGPATVAAPYCGPSPNHCVYVFEWATRASGKPDQDFALQMIPRESAAIRSGIQEVAALPTGLILYDMRVFDVLPPPWYCYEWTDVTQSEKATTEDVFQTRNASLLGLPQLCNWDAWANHMKTESVPKPMLITRDMVHESLKRAVLRGIDSGDRMIVLPRVEREEVADDGRI